MPSLLARQQGLPGSSAPARALATATTTEAARGSVSQDDNVERPSGLKWHRLARWQVNAAPGVANAPDPDETLVVDVRAALTPSEMVDRKLARLLGITRAGVFRRLPG